jgi:hypothetical protein
MVANDPEKRQAVTRITNKNLWPQTARPARAPKRCDQGCVVADDDVRAAGEVDLNVAQFNGLLWVAGAQRIHQYVSRPLNTWVDDNERRIRNPDSRRATLLRSHTLTRFTNRNCEGRRYGRLDRVGSRLPRQPGHQNAPLRSDIFPAG